MHSFVKTTTAVTALAVLASGQTPPGFSPAVTDNLRVSFGDVEITPPGLEVLRPITADIPSIASDDNLEGTYLLAIVDLDVPTRNNGVINSTAPRNQLLHALVPGYTQGDGGSLTSSEVSTAPATYRQPSPPYENPPVPHRYVEFLFQQPENFSVPKSQASVVQTRLPFNLSAFIEAAGLQAPIKANYFTVLNTTAPNATSTTPTPGAPSPSQFTGAAERLVGNAFAAVLAVGGTFLLL